MDIALIRRMAAGELEKRAFAELTGEEDTSLDSIFLAKAAQAEDPDLFRIAMRMQGDPIGNYEVLGGKYKAAEDDRPWYRKTLHPALAAAAGGAGGYSIGELTGQNPGPLAALGAGALGIEALLARKVDKIRHADLDSDTPPEREAPYTAAGTTIGGGLIGAGLGGAIGGGRGAQIGGLIGGAGLGGLSFAGAQKLDAAREKAWKRNQGAGVSPEEEEILKQAFGQAMFKAAPAPDPKVQATSAKPPTASGPKAPSGPTGPTGGGGTGAPAVQSVPSPSVSGGPASAGAGVGMG